MNRRTLVWAAVAAALVPAGLQAQNSDWNRYTLESLGGVYVSIESGAVCEGAGVTVSSLEASTSLRLIEAEVGVLTQAEMLEHPALPDLRLSLDCAEGPGGTVGYAVGLRLQQAAQMLRDTQITLPEAVTWYTTQVGVAASSDAQSALTAAVSLTLDAFVEAWNAANAEEGGAR